MRVGYLDLVHLQDRPLLIAGLGFREFLRLTEAYYLSALIRVLQDPDARVVTKALLGFGLQGFGES